MGHVRGRVARNCRGCARQLTEAVSPSLLPCRCGCVARTETWERARACIRIRSARSSFEVRKPRKTRSAISNHSRRKLKIITQPFYCFSSPLSFRVLSKYYHVLRARVHVLRARARAILPRSRKSLGNSSFFFKDATISLASGTSRRILRLGIASSYMHLRYVLRA